jgi:hypothetical protein
MTTPLNIAYHEAGHAICALALDIGITKLEARGCRYRPCNDSATWWRYAVMALGGPAAEQRYACFPIDVVAALAGGCGTSRTRWRVEQRQDRSASASKRTLPQAFPSRESGKDKPSILLIGMAFRETVVLSEGTAAIDGNGRPRSPRLPTTTPRPDTQGGSPSGAVWVAASACS